MMCPVSKVPIEDRCATEDGMEMGLFQDRIVLSVGTCVSDRKDAAWLSGHQLFQRKPAVREASSLCIHTAVQRDTVWATKSNCEEADSGGTRHVTLFQYHVNSQNEVAVNTKSLKISKATLASLISIILSSVCTSASHLDNRMPCWCSFDCSSAALCLVVGSVVRTGLHLDTQLVLVKLGWQWPVKRRQGVWPEGSRIRLF